ncbi:tetratricopeptide repeat protein [Nostoc sp. C117]|uniref:serine protease n=1 Tax=Nostoc sp. C117 TaxID=3349875 RepID=UPI00370D8B11
MRRENYWQIPVLRLLSSSKLDLILIPNLLQIKYPPAIMNHHQKVFIALLSSLFILPNAYVATSQQVANQATSVLANNSLSPEQIRQLAQAITVKVLSTNKGGSGVLISKQGHTYTVLTNAHVITNKGSYRIQTHDDKIYTATVINQGDSLKGNDLAVLQFQSQENYQIVALASTSNVSENQQVFAAGFPDDSKELVISSGKISLLSTHPLVGGYQIGYTNEIKQGMSGGALLNESGQLIGINGLTSNAILIDAYAYQDGTKPSAEQLQQLRYLSFAVPIQTLAKVAPNLAIIPPEWRSQQQAIKPAGNTFVDKINNIAEQISVRIDLKYKDKKNHQEQNGNGSGVIIAKQGNTYYVVTARHVVEDSYQHQIITPDGKRYAVQQENIFKPEGIDAALVKFTSNQTYSVATIAKYNLYSSNKNRWIFLSGFPGKDGGKRKFTAGVLRDKETISIRAVSLDYLNFVVDAGYELSYTNLTQPGMSGGAILDVMGQVVGINTASEGKTTAQIELGLGLGVPSSSILSLVTKSGLKPELLKLVTKAPPKPTEAEINGLINHPLFVAKKPSQNANEYEWLNYGNQLWRLQKNTESVAAFQQAIKLKPDFYEAYFALSSRLYRQKKYPEALAFLEKAIKIKPDSDEAWSIKSDMLSELKKYPEALAAVDKAIEYNSEEVSLYVRRGFLLRYLNRYPEALASITKAIEMKPLSNYYIERGIIRTSSKDNQGALADYNQAIKLDPDSANNYLIRGNIRRLAKDKQGAFADYNQAIKLEPDSTDGYIGRGNTRIQLGDFQNALADCNQAIKIEPDNAGGYDCRSRVRYTLLLDYQGALSDINEAIKLERENYSYYFDRTIIHYELEDYQGALADLDQAIKLLSNSEALESGSFQNQILAIQYGMKARVRYDLKDYQGGLADINQAIKFDPNNASGYQIRSNFRKELKDYQGALADINQAIKLEPDDANYYYRRGRIRKNLNDPQGAQTDYTKAIELYSQQIQRQPNVFFTYPDRGEVRENLNDLQGALADYTKAIELQPKYALAYSSRAGIYVQLKDYQAALADYNQAIKLEPDNIRAYSHRHEVYYRLKDYQRAIADLDQFIKLLPDKAEAYFLRGNDYVQLKNYQAAIADFSQAIKLQPDNVNTYSIRGLLRSQLKDYQGALSDYSQVLKIQPNNAEAYLLRGEIYVQLKDYQTALSNFNQVINLQPNNPQAHFGRGVIYQKKGNDNAALSEYNQALAKDAKLAPAIINIGYIKYETGDVEGAIDQWQNAVKINSSLAEPQMALAVALYAKGEQQKALSMAQAALHLDKSWADVEVLKQNLWGTHLIDEARKLLANPSIQTFIKQ